MKSQILRQCEKLCNSQKHLLLLVVFALGGGYLVGVYIFGGALLPGFVGAVAAVVLLVRSTTLLCGNVVFGPEWSSERTPRPPYSLTLLFIGAAALVVAFGFGRQMEMLPMALRIQATVLCVGFSLVAAQCIAAIMSHEPRKVFSMHPTHDKLSRKLLRMRERGDLDRIDWRD